MDESSVDGVAPAASDTSSRPTDRTTTRLATTAVAAAAVAVVATVALAPRLPSFLPALPVLMTLASTCGLVATFLVLGRARTSGGPHLLWAGGGLAVTTLAMWLQLIGFPAISPTGGPFGTTGDGAASLYLLWHLLLPAAALLGLSPLARRRWAAVGASTAAVGAVLWLSTGRLPGPTWFEESGAYTQGTTTAMWVLTALSLVAVLAWVRRIGPTPTVVETAVTAALVYALLDVLLHAVGPERFTVWWWSSLAMRVASTAVPAVWMSVAAVRLFNRLGEYADELERRSLAEAATTLELERLNDALERSNDGLTAANQQLGDTNDRLLRSNEDLERFAAVVAHDLRAPIAVIGGMIDVVLKVGQVDDESRGLLERAHRRQQQQAALVEDALRFARATGGELRPEHVELADVLDELTEEEGIGGALTVGPLAAVTADPTAVRQVVGNLVRNAVRHAGAGLGRLPQVEVVAVATDDGTVRITVTDDGPGVPPDERELVFQPYSRGTRAGHGGAGLGLAIVSALVERHGGETGLDSPPCGGARFWVTLPAGDRTSVSVSAPARPRVTAAE